MGNYANNFSASIDEIWDKHDIDKNNMLDKEEAKPFLDEIATVMIDEQRCNRYDTQRFEEVFQ